MLPVTKSYLPDSAKYQAYLARIFESGWLTNRGPLLQELEQRLAEYLGVKHLILVANGTVALELAYQALGLKGEVITTPFSFVATTSSLVSRGLTPVFADIDPHTFMMDPERVEALITDKTTAILPVHVFGVASNIKAIEAIAKKHHLKVIYDAAHAFGVQYQQQSILNYGDVSTISFHATKLFHTIEGGAVVVNDDVLAEKIRALVNFGMTSPTHIPYAGVNAKMNEFEAAMGLCVLDDIEHIIATRAQLCAYYDAQLGEVVQLQHSNSDANLNFSYYPVVFDSETQLLKVLAALNAQQIFPRRYFYPSLDQLDYLVQSNPCPISQDIARRILCLPLFVGLTQQEQDQIIGIVKQEIKTSQ